jgi:hypothetical protein
MPNLAAQKVVLMKRLAAQNIYTGCQTAFHGNPPSDNLGDWNCGITSE